MPPASMPPASVPPAYSLVNDPLYFVTAGFFAIFTTALPAAMGQPRFLPILQAVVLTIFIAMPIRKGQIRTAAYIMALWLVLEVLVMVLVTHFLPGSAERAVGNGFGFRTALLAWLYAGEPLPNGWSAAPLTRLVQLIGVSLGSLLTAGFVGAWFLVRAVNQLGFAIAIAGASLGGPLGWLLAIPLWSLAWIAGLAGLIIVCAEPLLTSNWSITFYGKQRRALLVAVAALLAAGLLLELLLAPAWTHLVS